MGYNSYGDMITFAQNADVLLIEATLLKSDNINNKYHLHAYEAAEIALSANVKNLILTHFWPTTDKKKYLLEAKKVFKDVTLAFENLIIKF